MNIELKNNYLGIAKRKNSLAVIKLIEGEGKIIINNKSFKDYFNNYKIEKKIILYPFLILKLETKYNILIKVKGGGLMSQLKAIQLAISKLLVYYNINFKKILKKFNLLKKDNRIKERKKFGLKKARKASQYSKR
jgi:small subunit ribosomal protein S9